jgi:hypothetical protein
MVDRVFACSMRGGRDMPILLWLLGVPLTVVILLMLLGIV